VERGMGVDLFGLMQERLYWTLAENIANADTPGYQPRDLPAFQARLADQQLMLATTDAHHIAPARTDSRHLLTTSRSLERALDGNGVSLETELTKVADTASAQQITTQLYTTYIGMFHTAIDKGS
jgi:flagellar basal-body rod protein FlgB